MTQRDLCTAGSSSWTFNCHSILCTALRAAASCCCRINKHVWGGGETKHKSTWYMHDITVSKPLTEDITANFYLHAVIFIIHILDPGNELASVEAISHRFVLITLRTYTKLQCRLCNGFGKIRLPLIKFVII